MKKSTLVFTIAIGVDYAHLTVPYIRAYAERIGADFILVDTLSIFPDSTSCMAAAWEKFRYYDYLARYTRVLFIDADILVRKDCPNLFDIVEPDKIGMVNEITSARQWGNLLRPRAEISFPSVERMERVAAFYHTDPPDLRWSLDHHYNSGVIVASQCHRDFFAPPERKYVEGTPWDQSVVNLRLGTRAGIAVQDLPYTFNHTRYPAIRTPVPRRNSYLLHYNVAPKTVAAIAADIEAWKKMGKL